MAPFVNANGTLNDTPGNRAQLAAQRLDADRMIALEKRFGPLDWRMAETHAIYWATQGSEFATDTERLMCSRGVYQPLMLSVLRGSFTGDLAHKQWQCGENLALAIATADYMATVLNQFPSNIMRSVYLNYLSQATSHTSKKGLTNEAHTLYARLLAALPAQSAKPTFDDVVNGWNFKPDAH